MIKKLGALLISAAILASLAACSQSSAEINKENAGTKATESRNIEGDKTGKVDNLVIAYLPNEAKEDLSEYRKGVAADMEKALNVKVKEFLASDYNAAIEAMRTGKADLAFFGPLSYSQAHERANAEPLVAPAPDSDKSKAGYYSIIITQAKNDKINSITDLKGKRFAFVDANSTSGNLVPSFEILKAVKDDKLSFEDLHTNGKFFESVSFSGAHQNGIQAVLKGDVDAAPCDSTIFQRELNSKKFSEKDIKIIFKSPLIPPSIFAIRSDLPDDFKKVVKDFYLKYDNDDYFKKFMGQKEGQKLRFVDIKDEDYQSIHDLRKKFGL